MLATISMASFKSSYLWQDGTPDQRLPNRRALLSHSIDVEPLFRMKSFTSHFITGQHVEFVLLFLLHRHTSKEPSTPEGGKSGLVSSGADDRFKV